MYCLLYYSPPLLIFLSKKIALWQVNIPRAVWCCCVKSSSCSAKRAACV